MGSLGWPEPTGTVPMKGKAPVVPRQPRQRSKGGIKSCSSPAWPVPEVRFSSFRADVTFAPVCVPTSWSTAETPRKFSP